MVDFSSHGQTLDNEKKIKVRLWMHTNERGPSCKRTFLLYLQLATMPSMVRLYFWTLICQYSTAPSSRRYNRARFHDAVPNRIHLFVMSNVRLCTGSGSFGAVTTDPPRR